MTDTLPPAGRELDALVAVEVMGYVPCTNAKAHPGGQTIAECVAFPDSPDQGGETELYSTTGNGGLAVLERMRTQGWGWQVQDRGVGRADALFAHGPAPNGKLGRAVATTLPEAICHAALLAVRAEAATASDTSPRP